MPADKEFYLWQIEATERQVNGLLSTDWGEMESAEGGKARRARRGAVNGFRERIERIGGSGLIDGEAGGLPWKLKTLRVLETLRV
jgi:hypothetical protein